MGGVILTDGGLNIWTSPTNLTHWTESLVGGSTINREATDKIEGDYSCRLDVDAANSGSYLYQLNIVLTPLKRYKLVIWYKNSLAGKTGQANFFDMGSNVYLKEDGTWNIGAYNITLPNSIIWKKFEVYFYAHVGYTNYRLNLTRAVAASSSIYFDDVGIYYFTGGSLSMSMDMKL